MTPSTSPPPSPADVGASASWGSTNDFPFNMLLAQVKSLEFTIGLCSVQYELPALLSLTAAGRLDPGSIVTDHLALADGADAYARFAARDNGVSKVVLDMPT